LKVYKRTQTIILNKNELKLKYKIRIQKMPTCKFKNCKISSSFGVRGTVNAIYCAEHKEVDHVNVVDKKCLECDKIPCFGIKGTKDAIYCSEHKEVDHVNVKDKMCLKCDTRANFGIKGTNKPIYCLEHKEVDHIDVVHDLCLKCGTRATFGIKGTKKPLYCLEHKRDEHVNVVDKMCLECDKRANFGIKGTNKPLYCLKHKGQDHVDVVHDLCLKCDKRANFGIKGTKKAIYCLKHKDKEHVNVMDKMCIECDIKQATFGIRGTKKPLYCLKHKGEEHVDVKHKLCDHDKCKSRENYGHLFKPKTHCAKHKTKNEFKYNKPKCEHNKCKLIPCYTDQDDNYPLRCEDHCLENDKNVIERNCISCNLVCMLTKDSLCNDCSEYINRKPHKRKETIIKNVLDANKLEYDTYDKIPTESCNKYRPDFVFDRGTHIIILEVDENQHHSYNCECEQARMINLFQDFGGLPVIFVRFNPDGYTDNKNKRIQYNKAREKRLLTTLNSLLIHIPKDLLSVIYLYYNGDDGTNKIISVDYEKNNVKEYEIIFEDDEDELENDEDDELEF
jgi:hypothetical protein